MNIDEYLGALAQSLELLASMHRDTGRHLADLAEKADRRSAETNQRFAETLQFINRLANVAEAHS